MSDRPSGQVSPAPPRGGGQPRRPLFWRAPLLVVVIVGVMILLRLDSLLVSDYRKDASGQAAQTDALLEGFIAERLALLSSLRALYAAPEATRGRRQFDGVVREIVAEAPDLFAVYLLDPTGTVRATYRRTGEDAASPAANHLELPGRGSAIRRARYASSAAITGSVPLADAGAGMIMYLPIVRDSAIAGFIGAALAYQSLFNYALGGQLRGRFAYRVRDASGTTIAVSPGYPDQPAGLVSREVALPGGTQRWQLDVAIPFLQPFLPRVITWIAGSAFLVIIVLLVLREEARTRRFARHSQDLELVSRNLLDANVRLEERSQQIAEANRAKSRFLANVSHELRTPLNAIVGYNSLAMDGVYGELPASISAAHDRIRAASEHLLALVNDVLDLSKIEVGRMELDVQEVGLDTIIDSVVTVLEPVAEGKGLRLDVFVEHTLPRITTDGRHVRQILMNLVSNAIKFTDAGSVTIIAQRTEQDDEREGEREGERDDKPDNRAGRARVSAGAIAVVVEDTGIGIARNDVRRIFEEFEQVRPGGRGDSMQRGTGLGLAIASKLTRLLGGEITVESEPGRGARFTLHLPAQSPSSPDRDAPTPARGSGTVRADETRITVAPFASAVQGERVTDEEGAEAPAVASESGARSGLDADARPG